MAWEYSARHEIEGVLCYTERRDSETAVTETIKPVPVEGAPDAADAEPADVEPTDAE
ncbi:MAG TPA: hypothetical protein VFB20_15635 [Burkholderiales bacterium]|nr:hypothetical protein [Burkholderiales bacterium]